MKYINYIIPEVEPPKFRLDIVQRLKNTLFAVILYFLLASTPLFGISETTLTRFSSLLVLLGASHGSLISLGIGPIVTGMIILELLMGAEIIRIDMKTEEGKRKFRTLMKWFALAFIIIENVAWVSSGMIPPREFNIFWITIVSLQLIAGGIILMILDDYVDKWGIGSGISLFIVAGVSMRVFSRLFSPILSNGIPIGAVFQVLFFLMKGDFYNFILSFIPIFSFFLVLALSAWGYGVKVEIPLTFGRIRGQSIRWPISLLFISNIPVIFAAAMMANIRLWALNAWRAGNPFLGTFTNVTTPEGVYEVPASGFIYYITPEPIYDAFLGKISWLTWTIKALSYTVFITLLSVLFAKLWITIAPGMSPESIAEMITSQYMSIPGFRSDKRVVERILSRYINSIAVMGGFFVGLLAGLADIFGAPAGGTSILLSVLIILNYYEMLKRQYSREMPPFMRKFLLGKE